MCTYHHVAKIVEPKTAALRAAEAELRLATKERMGAEEMLANVQAKLDDMQAGVHSMPTHICSELYIISHWGSS
jgi:dynein heavy chain, axonemal